MISMASHDESSAYDSVADDYEVARPGYPVGVFEAIEAYADFDAPPRVVEVGSGTGQATRQMAARGWTVDGIEPGPRLAATARAQVSSRNTEFHVTRFEDALLEAGSFDLVAAATSWHWVDVDVAYRKAHSFLKANGTIALVLERTRSPHQPPSVEADPGRLPRRRTGTGRPRTAHPRPHGLRPRDRAQQQRTVRSHRTPCHRLRSEVSD